MTCHCPFHGTVFLNHSLARTELHRLNNISYKIMQCSTVPSGLISADTSSIPIQCRVHIWVLEFHVTQVFLIGLVLYKVNLDTLKYRLHTILSEAAIAGCCTTLHRTTEVPTFNNMVVQIGYTIIRLPLYIHF